MAVFGVVAPCSLVEVYQRFKGPCCLLHHGDAKNASKTINILVLSPTILKIDQICNKLNRGTFETIRCEVKYF
jgi:hypothetical protein